MRAHIATLAVALGLVYCTNAAPRYSCFDPPGEDQTNPLGEGMEDIVEDECCEALVDESDILAEIFVVWEPVKCNFGPGLVAISAAPLCSAHNTDGCRFCRESCDNIEGACVVCSGKVQSTTTTTTTTTTTATTDSPTSSPFVSSSEDTPAPFGLFPKTPAPFVQAALTITPTPSGGTLVDTPSPIPDASVNNPAPITEASLNTPAPFAETSVATPAPVTSRGGRSPVAQESPETPAPITDASIDTLAPIAESLVESPAPVTVTSVEDTRAPITEALVATPAPIADTSRGARGPIAQASPDTPAPVAQGLPDTPAPITNVETLAPIGIAPRNTSAPITETSVGTASPITEAEEPNGPSASTPTPTATEEVSTDGSATAPPTPMVTMANTTITTTSGSSSSININNDNSTSSGSSNSSSSSSSSVSGQGSSAGRLEDANDPADCGCDDNLSAAGAVVLASQGKILVCDPTCTDGSDLVWGVMNCNYFALGQNCRACAEICNIADDGIWLDDEGAFCKPCSAIISEEPITVPVP